LTPQLFFQGIFHALQALQCAHMYLMLDQPRLHIGRCQNCQGVENACSIAAAAAAVVLLCSHSRKGSVRVSTYFFKFFARQRFVPSHIEVRMQSGKATTASACDIEYPAI
jgi:hypothetical protein